MRETTEIIGHSSSPIHERLDTASTPNTNTIHTLAHSSLVVSNTMLSAESALTHHNGGSSMLSDSTLSDPSVLNIASVLQTGDHQKMFFFCLGWSCVWHQIPDPHLACKFLDVVRMVVTEKTRQKQSDDLYLVECKRMEENRLLEGVRLEERRLREQSLIQSLPENRRLSYVESLLQEERLNEAELRQKHNLECIQNFAVQGLTFFYARAVAFRHS